MCRQMDIGICICNFSRPDLPVTLARCQFLHVFDNTKVVDVSKRAMTDKSLSDVTKFP